jgi:hypothetical protein
MGNLTVRWLGAKFIMVETEFRRSSQFIGNLMMTCTFSSSTFMVAYPHTDVPEHEAPEETTSLSLPTA